MPEGGGQTANDPSGWSVDTLREYLLSVITANDLRYAERFKAQAEAVSKAEVASEKRFDSVNEFRKTLSDQTATFATRADLDAAKELLSSKVDGLKTRADRGAGTIAGVGTSWGYLIGVAGFLTAVIALVHSWPK